MNAALLLTLATCGQIPAEALRPYDELIRELNRPRLEQRDKLQKELETLYESVTAAEKKKLTTAEKRDLAKNKKRLTELDAEIKKLSVTTDVVPKLTIDKLVNQSKAGWNGPIACVVSGGRPATGTIIEEYSGSNGAFVTRVDGIDVVISFPRGKDPDRGQKITLDKPCKCGPENYLFFFDDKSSVDIR